MTLLQDENFREQVADTEFIRNVGIQQFYHAKFYRSNRTQNANNQNQNQNEEIPADEMEVDG